MVVNNTASIKNGWINTDASKSIISGDTEQPNLVLRIIHSGHPFNTAMKSGLSQSKNSVKHHTFYRSTYLTHSSANIYSHHKLLSTMYGHIHIQQKTVQIRLNSIAHYAASNVAKI